MSQTDSLVTAQNNLTVCVARALENAAWTLEEFCRNDDARRRVWGEISSGAHGRGAMGGTTAAEQ